MCNSTTLGDTRAVAFAGKNSGVQGYDRHRRGSGDGSTDSEKIISEENCKNGIILDYFQKDFTTQRYIFARLDKKHNSLGTFSESFENI